MSKVTLDAGTCGYRVGIKAHKKGKKGFIVELVSPCEMVSNLNKELKDEVFDRKIFTSILDSPVYKLCSKHLKHVACPLPSAILKAIEVEDGLAVPKNVIMKIEEV